MWYVACLLTLSQVVDYTLTEQDEKPQDVCARLCMCVLAGWEFQNTHVTHVVKSYACVFGSVLYTAKLKQKYFGQQYFCLFYLCLQDVLNLSR